MHNVPIPVSDSKSGGWRYDFLEKSAGDCTSYDVIDRWPNLTRSFFCEKLCKWYPINSAKFRRDPRIGSAAISEKKTQRGFNTPPPARAQMNASFCLGQMRFKSENGDWKATAWIKWPVLETCTQKPAMKVSILAFSSYLTCTWEAFKSPRLAPVGFAIVAETGYRCEWVRPFSFFHNAITILRTLLWPLTRWTNALTEVYVGLIRYVRDALLEMSAM